MTICSQASSAAETSPLIDGAAPAMSFVGAQQSM
jgi:hypothetical protein